MLPHRLSQFTAHGAVVRTRRSRKLIAERSREYRGDECLVL
jgi:hypothetical protein